VQKVTYFQGAANLSGKPVDIKQHNQRLVISLLRRGNALPASELAAAAGLSKTTISKILAELCSRNLVYSVGKGDSTVEGGKKPELFAVNAGYAATIVLVMPSMGSFTCSVVDLCGGICYQKEYKNAEKITYEELAANMAAALRQANAVLEEQGSAVCGIAVGYGGVVNTETGEILYPLASDSAVFRPLRDDLLAHFPTEHLLYIDNTCHFSGNAELLLDENRDLDHIAVVFCGDTVNGCSLSRPLARPGQRGIVGEFGHLIVDPSATVHCYCGCRGCLESLISRRAVMARARSISGNYPFSEQAKRIENETVTMDELFNVACADDCFAQDVLWPVIKYLAILIRGIDVLENVSKVIIQGVYARMGENFLELIRREVQSYNRLNFHKDFTVEFSRYSRLGPEEDKRACICGAAAYTSNFYLERLVTTFYEA